MKITIKCILIALVSLVGLIVVIGGICIFLIADYYSGPNEKECVKIAEKFLGCKFGDYYQFLDYDADYSHPDRPLSFFINIPTEDFRAVINHCYDEAEKKDGIKDTTEKKGYTYIETFSRTSKGFQKEQEVLYGDIRVHYQILEVILDLESISFTSTNY